MAEITGSDNSETLEGTAEDDRIKSRDGDDTVYGREGNDWINGRYDALLNDTYSVYNGTLIAYGGDGDDLIGGKRGDDELYGGPGDDRIFASQGNDLVVGGDGNDNLSGADGNDRIEGGGGDDRLHSGDGEDRVYGGPGADWINASYDPGGQILYFTYDGPLAAFGGEGHDLIGGKEGHDEIDGGPGDDVIHGWGGNDRLFGDEGNDLLTGGYGDDLLIGGPGIDRLYGGEGNDTYHVNDLHDRIWDEGGIDSAVVSVSFAKIPGSIENVSYTDGALALPYWIDALLHSGANGSHYKNLLGEEKTFRYIFPTRPPSYEFDFGLGLLRGYRQLSATQQQNAVTVLENLEQIIDVKVTQTNEADQPNTFAIALTQQQDTGGYATYPDAHSSGSDIYLNNADPNATLDVGTPGAYVLVHELGHALGLKHPFHEHDAGGEIGDPPYLQGSEDHARWTMMSYTETRAEHKHSFSELDIAALQYLYGPSQAVRSGDDRYVYNPHAANFIWDGAGDDTIDASLSPEPVTIFLRPGYHGFRGSAKSTQITAAGQITVNFGSEIENLLGSDHADQLTGNQLDNDISGRGGNDRIFGEEGNDTLTGGPDDDLLRGGVGDDSLRGDAGNDRLFGEDGNDRLDGGEGNDRLDGGEGNDRLAGGDGANTLTGGPGLDFGIFSGRKDDYTLSVDRDQVISVVKNSQADENTDELQSIERLEFSDISVAFDMEGNAGIAARVLGAFLGPAGIGRADLAGRFLAMLDDGTTYDGLLQSVLNTTFGSNPDGTSLVSHFYRALTAEEAPDDVIAEWGGRIDRGELSALELSRLVADYDLNLSNIDLAGLASVGIEYLLG